jgi:hypothetical protein
MKAIQFHILFRKYKLINQLKHLRKISISHSLSSVDKQHLQVNLSLLSKVFHVLKENAEERRYQKYYSKRFLTVIFSNWRRYIFSNISPLSTTEPEDRHYMMTKMKVGKNRLKQFCYRSQKISFNNYLSEHFQRFKMNTLGFYRLKRNTIVRLEMRIVNNIGRPISDIHNFFRMMTKKIIVSKQVKTKFSKIINRNKPRAYEFFSRIKTILIRKCLNSSKIVSFNHKIKLKKLKKYFSESLFFLYVLPLILYFHNFII